MELSNYQKDIINYIKNKTGNLLVNAKAGSGKTSTLISISEELKKENKKSLFLAFNKSIVEELQQKLPDKNFNNIKTIHSTGYSFILSYLYKKYGKDKFKVTINGSKKREIVKKIFEEKYLDLIKDKLLDYCDEDDLKETCNKIISEIVKLSDFVLFYCINYMNPKEIADFRYSDVLVIHELVKETGMDQYFASLVKETILEDINIFNNPVLNDDVYEVVIDYTDMLFLPLYFNMFVPYSLQPYLDYVLVDESQDLSILQQMFLKKIQKRDGSTRYIFVGDEKQAIYGFSGADTHSIENIKLNFELNELPLNICYRCPKNIIKLSQEIVPSIEWNKARTDEGIVKIMDTEKLSQKLKPNDMIIGRKNKDLVEIYKDLVLNKRIKLRFRNIDIVNSIYNEIEACIKRYIQRYNRYENIEVDLCRFIYVNDIPIIKAYRSFDQSQDLKNYANELVKSNKNTAKNIMKSKFTLDYLITCMSEYQNNGSYKSIKNNDKYSILFELDEDLYDYFNIIKLFINEYLVDKFQISKSELKENFDQYIIETTVKDFLKYLNDFLHCNDMINDVPIISTIHGMKGSEAQRVFILNYPYFPYHFINQSEDQAQQEFNLQYVALTRSKSELYLLKIAVPEDASLEESISIQMKNDKCEQQILDLLKQKDKEEIKSNCSNIEIDNRIHQIDFEEMIKNSMI